MAMLAAMATASLGDPAADYVARGNAALAKGDASGAIADFTSAIGGFELLPSRFYPPGRPEPLFQY